MTQLSLQEKLELEKDTLISGGFNSDSRFEEWHSMNSNLLHNLSLIRSDYGKALKQRKHQLNDLIG